MAVAVFRLSATSRRPEVVASPDSCISRDGASSFGGRLLGGGLLVGASGAGLMLSSAASADAPKADLPAQEASMDHYARPTNLTGIPENITLYQYEVCPFCCKVKAVLDYHKLPYTVVEVNPLTKAELKWSTYRKVPVVKYGDEVVMDSTAIASRVAAECEAKGVSKRGRANKGMSVEEETKWRKWVDERFVKIITANIYRSWNTPTACSWNESLDTFKYITEQTNWGWGTRELARMSGAVIMWQVGKKMPKKYNIEGDLRVALYEACDELVDAVGPNRLFLGGDQPNLADLAAYGVLTAVARTPTYEDALANSRIRGWYDRVAVAIGPSSRTGTIGSEWGLANAANPVVNKAAKAA
ncbi:hypothetical protein FOA52_007380 [Chlamydomonas sp. UWO 241]|nr:hypothetical protein FOA52_007380 [Chlamydomonas sp. UWO 241]